MQTIRTGETMLYGAVENRWPTCPACRPNPKLRNDRPLVALLIHQIDSMNILIALL